MKKSCFQVVVDGSLIYVVEQDHHLLGEPHVFIGVDGFDVPLAAGCDKCPVLRCR